ncbi:glutathione S-transferase [Hyphobacterium sp. HN65]|uniref:Glutathione S-transferase n=1 Tax=Hyphobacterium lacteum TaxID=3116575 RepID=A0ABU7LTX7_9PROT|nr:glutathione S-transferase [Hyphobacterium sp. HN65]MEE2527359.1 glutathione S-transferase [Hyphobacterium sp. HN65]
MSKTLPVLYSFRRCPYAMRGRMALDVAGIELEHREILLKDKPADMLAASPKGTVPVLVLPDGTVIEESLDVMNWALSQNDPENWLAPGEDMTALISTNDGEFKHHLDRYKYATRYDGAVAEEHRAEASVIVGGLDGRLAGSEQLMGDAVSLADIAIFPFIRQFANTDRDWFDAQDWPDVKRWLAGHLASDRFARIMKKHDLWVPEKPSSGGQAAVTNTA